MSANRGRSDFFASPVTPWDEPGQVAIWMIGAFLGALVAHNVDRAYRKSKGKL